LKNEIEKQLEDIEEDTQKPLGNTKSVILSYYVFFTLLLFDIFSYLNVYTYTYVWMKI